MSCRELNLFLLILNFLLLLLYFWEVISRIIENKLRREDSVTHEIKKNMKAGLKIGVSDTLSKEEMKKAVKILNKFEVRNVYGSRKRA